MVELDDRFARQAQLIPRPVLDQLEVGVIGVGAIGRQVALQLAALGVRTLRLMDFDRVELTNITTQGYCQGDLGLAKVVATAKAVQAIDPLVHLELVEDRYRPTSAVGEAVFCCVDTITARQCIWRGAGQWCRFWCDARMLGETIRVLAVTNTDQRAYYPTTLFAQADTVPGTCTARGAIYTAAIAGGLMIHQFARWLRRQPVERDLALNLLASELVVS